MKTAKILFATVLAVFLMNGQTALGQWTESGGAVYLTNLSNKVGIGTTTPSELLHVFSSTTVANLKVESSAAANVGVKLVGPDQAWRIQNLYPQRSFRIRDVTAGTTPFEIEPGASETALHIDASGNIGIGTKTPNATLSVNGPGAVIGGDFFFAFNKGGPNDTALQVRGDQASAIDIVSEYNFASSGAYHISTVLSPVFGFSGLFLNQPADANRLPFTFNMGGLGEVMRLHSDGNVGIGEPNPQSKLAVDGTVTTKEVVVTDVGWSDFVFEDDYALRPLEEVERYIDEHGRLPEIPSAAEVEANGARLGEMQTKLLQKIEELTLYIIAQNKQMEALNTALQKLQVQQETSLQ